MKNSKPVTHANSHTNKQAIDTVLFDLDGTLVDTAPDLALSLNILLKLHQKKALPFEKIRPEVSNGAAALITLGFKLSTTDQKFKPLHTQLLSIYDENLCKETKLFPGMSELLLKLEQLRMPWGVITNKPSRFTIPLMDSLNLSKRAACIICGDTTGQRKPHPQPMHLASHTIGTQSQRCLYVGDAHRDIEAGRRAGMKTLIALFGYIHENDQPEQWQADGTISAPLEILNWLAEHNRLTNTTQS